MSECHGGPDALGVPAYDFSTNGNACGPCQLALADVQHCDARHYPDPSYAALRQGLADFHAVEPWRIVLAGSASEFISRITGWVYRGSRGDAPAQDSTTVSVPVHAYSDYAAMAQAWELAVVHQPHSAALSWACEPSSPMGQGQVEWSQAYLATQVALTQRSVKRSVHVLDCAYAPLRLSGTPTVLASQRNSLWQLWSPNKALGLTGLRGAYAIAPTDAHDTAIALNNLCPSWPLGVHAVAMLQAWVKPEVQRWLSHTHVTLRGWKERQVSRLEALGWTCLPSDASFFAAQPFNHAGDDAADNCVPAIQHLRHAGVKLRDARSFGLPGYVRVSVLPPAAQDALIQAWNVYRSQQ